MQCKTRPSDITSRLSVTMEILRLGMIVSTNGSSLVTFEYLEPTITSTYPSRGPLAGGSQLVIHGNNFNIGNISKTRVLLGQTPCNIRYFSEREIDSE